MIYQGGDMILGTVWEVFRGPVNDVAVCRDLKSPVGTQYTVLVVKERSAVKTLLALPEEERGGRRPYLCRFSQNELMCFVFEYRAPRKLSAFAPGQMTSARVREEICVNLVLECLSSPYPFPLLYLILTQDNVHLEKDNSVYFTPCLNLAALNEKKGEGRCVSCCADLLLELLEGGGQRRRPLKSYELIRKKSAKNAYSTFPELYQDIKVTALPDGKPGLSTKLEGFWRRNKDRIFHLLLALCIIIVAMAAVMLVSQLIFGDVPLLRLFSRAFERIGTEVLTK